jgi:predicted SAM-dependent methyltransferase
VSSAQRLNWGCGDHTLAGWINCDRKRVGGIDLSCDILEGLPLAAASIDYAASIHALGELSYEQVVPALSELWRVLKPGGVLRLCLPDLLKCIRAYDRGEAGFFPVPDEDARTLGGKLVTHLVWYGHNRTLFTADFVEELLLRAGFQRVDHCRYRQTRSSFPDITALDNREGESLYVEATK